MEAENKESRLSASDGNERKCDVSHTINEFSTMASGNPKQQHKTEAGKAPTPNEETRNHKDKITIVIYCSK